MARNERQADINWGKNCEKKTNEEDICKFLGERLHGTVGLAGQRVSCGAG